MWTLDNLGHFKLDAQIPILLQPETTPSCNTVLSGINNPNLTHGLA